MRSIAFCFSAFAVLALASVTFADEIQWGPDADGSWNDAVNWDPSLPGGGDNVTIDVGGATVRTITSGGATVGDLTCQENLSASGGFTINGVAEVNGDFSLTNGSLSLSQSGASLTALNTTNLYNTDVWLYNGARASFDSLASYSTAGPGGTHINRYLVAYDPGTQLNLPSLTQFTGSWGNNGGPNAARVFANDGGSVDLSGVTTAGQRIYFSTRGAGSVLDLSSLETFTGAMHTTTDQDISSLGSISANDGGVILLDSLTRAERVSFYASNGSSLNMPSMTTYYNPVMSSTIKADGAGSVVDMSAVTSFTGGIGTEKYVTHLQPNWNYQANITAANGGQVDLSAVTAINSQVVISASGVGSVVDLSGLASLRMGTAPVDLSRKYTYFTISASDGGTVRLGSGTMALAATTQQDLCVYLLAETGTVEVGTLQLESGTRLQAVGTIDGNLTSSGRISVNNSVNASGAFLLTVTGDYAMTSTSSLYMGIDGYARTMEYDALDVGGISTLDGHLGVSLTGGFVPIVGDQFDLISAANFTGDFDTLSLPTLPDNLEWNVLQSDNMYSLLVVPEPTSLALLCMGVFGFLLHTRRRR